MDEFELFHYHFCHAQEWGAPLPLCQSLTLIVDIVTNKSVVHALNTANDNKLFAPT
jgi:hypothetical protein